MRPFNLAPRWPWSACESILETNPNTANAFRTIFNRDIWWKCLRSASYVVHAKGLGKQTVAERSIEVSALLKSDRLVLDANYYIEKKIIPPLERIFNLVGANVRQWYYEMPKYRPPRKGDAQARGPLTLDDWLACGASACLVCQRRISSSGKSKLQQGLFDADNRAEICASCMNERDQSVDHVMRRLARAQKRYHELHTICKSCSGSEEIACDSLDCSLYYSRVRASSWCKREEMATQKVLGLLM